MGSVKHDLEKFVFSKRIRRSESPANYVRRATIARDGNRRRRGRVLLLGGSKYSGDLSIALAAGM